MFAAFQGYVSPESFTLNESIAVLAMVVLGGMGHVPGVVIGSIILAALPEVLRHVVEPLQRHVLGYVAIESELLRQLLLGLTMVLMMLTRPAGLLPSRRRESHALPDTDAKSSAARTNMDGDRLAA